MLYLYINEIKRIVKKNKKFLVNLTGFLCSVIIIALSLNYYIIEKKYEQDLKDSYGDKAFFKITYEGDDLNDMFDTIFGDETILNVSRAVAELDSSSIFTHSYSDADNIFFLDGDVNYKEECQSGYEDGTINDETTVLKVVYADNQFFNGKFLKLSSGRAFTEADHYVANSTNIQLPIILGDGYSELYEIGDVIKNANLWDEHTVDFYIVGFLQKDSCFYDNNNDLVDLDYYMVVPDILPTYDPVQSDGSIDSFYEGAYSGIKLMNSRIICDKADVDEVKQAVMSILNNNQLYDFYLFDETAGAVRTYEGFQYFTTMNLIIMVIIVSVCFIMILLSVNAKILSELKNYSIYLLLGFSKKKIFVYAALETIMIFMLGDVLAAMVFSYMYIIDFSNVITQIPVLLFILSLQIIQLAIVWLITMKNIMKKDLSSLLHRKE